MKIVADENIQRVSEYFNGPWQLVTLPGREISADIVRDADILLVRSVTRVDAGLLEGSDVKLVGTATSGMDHIDEDYLSRRSIPLHHAAGSNAVSVVEYVFCALAALNSRREKPWEHSTIGIVGAGHIGGRLARLLSKLHIDTKIHDPFLSPGHEFADRLTTLDEVLNCDAVTFHVPLTRTGEHPTWHLLDRRRINDLKPGTVVINSARGEVVDNAALAERLENNADLDVVMDTWESEPLISENLARRVRIGTPHIAGYSAMGKIRATAILREACNSLLGRPAAITSNDMPLKEIVVPLNTEKDSKILDYCLLNAYPIGSDHQQLMHALDYADTAAGFDALRKHYPPRAEFSQHRVAGNHLTDDIIQKLKTLGFFISENNF